MIKNLPFAFLAFLFSLVIYGQETITMTSTSSNATWQLARVTNSGALFEWSASNALIGTQTATANAPVFDFSANDGSTINITITSSDNFNGLTELDLYNTAGGESSFVNDIDITKALNLTTFAPRNSTLSSIDVSQNTALQRLFLIGNRQVPDQALNTNSNTQLFSIRIDGSGINSVDLSNNPLLTNVQLNNARLTSSVLDKVLIDLDNHGLSGGNLRIASNPGTVAISAVTAYNNLIGKGWTIDIPEPVGPIVQEITMTSTSSTSAWRLARITNSGDILQWEASNDLFTLTATENNPTFNFSVNDGRPINISITSTDNFAGLTELDLRNVGSADLSAITSIDISKALNLTTFAPNRSSLASIDVSQNTLLRRLFILANNQVPDQALNTSANTQLFDLRITGSGINSVNLSNNPLLTNVQLNNARLTSAVLDQVLIDLDNHGLSGGNLQVAGQTTGQSITIAALIAYNNLVGKGWTIDVPAPAAAPGPEINVTLDGTSIPTGNVPAIADGSDFGQVAIGSPVTKAVRVENLGDSPLILNFYFTSGLYFNFVQPGGGGIVLAPGATYLIDVTFNPFSFGVQTGSITINNTDPNENPYIINLRAEGVTTLADPAIVVSGNSVIIANGDTTPDVADDTNFGQVINNGTKTNTFSIANNGTGNLTISNINVVNFQNTEFSVEPLTYPIVIAEGSSFDFDVTFSPLISGNFSAAVQISHSDTDESTPFTFRVTGQGVENILLEEIMISQYYSGFNSNDKWIEVKNISGAPIAANTYYLALYSHVDIPNISTVSPTQNTAIPAMGVDEVLLFRSGSATIPSAGNIGGATQIISPVCNFDGDDVILISTTNDATCYANRQDIIGYATAVTTWGRDASFIKGGCATETAHLDFNIADWIEIFPLNAVDVADPNTNLALGTQVLGPTEFDGTSWSNLTPDQSRTAIITNSFSNASQTFTVCNLTINPGVNVVYDSNGATNNSIVVHGDLTINGSLVIGDTESLVTLDPGATLGAITKIERSETLANLHDNTYWSSPVLGSQIQTIFSGVNPSRIFEYKPGDSNPIYEIPGYENYVHWFNKPSGAMDRGYGYAAEGPAAPVSTGDDYVSPLRHELTFIGVPNNGTFSINTYFKGVTDQGLENDNFNLIGNPYPTAINIETFLTSNPVVSQVAIWTHGTEISGGTGGSYTPADYIYYTSAGPSEPGVTENIGSAQGFMARTIAYGNISFNNGLKMIDANNQFFKTEIRKKSDLAKNEEDKLWLRLKDGKEKSGILVAYLEKATDGLDDRYDASGGLGEKNIGLYSQMGESKLAIQALGVFSPEKSVPLGITVKEAKDLTIGMTGKAGIFRDMDIYLVDHALNKTHNLKEGDYTFTQTTTGDFPNRFTLQFSKNAVDVDKIIEGSEFNVFNSAEGFRINASKVVKEVKVYDMLGKNDHEQQAKSAEF